MFNGYNETPLISYDFNQDRGEKKQENVAKWSYGHEVAGVQPAQVQANARHGEFWPGKTNFLGVSNLVKCNCAGCYPGAQKQSYQVDTTRHRPWLPRTFQVPANCSSEPNKLPGYQWENQGSCYPETNIPYGQDKYSYYKLHQNSNQPGVITSLKNAEQEKKPKNEMQEAPAIQNGARHPAFCNSGYGLAKRPSYCDPMEKYSNTASYPVDQHVGRLPVVEPFSKPVPSNLSQSRVPSTGYRSVKENVPQSYVDLSYGTQRKLCTETPINGDKRPDVFPTGNVDYFSRDLTEDPKLYFENTRHPDYYLRTNFQDAAKRNGQTLDNRKDCAINQMNEMGITGQTYGSSRGKYGNSCEAFYPKEFEKTRTENQASEPPPCYQGNCEPQSRLPPSALLFDPDRTQNSYSYQSNPVGYRNHLVSYPYQEYNTQPRFEYSTGRNDPGQYRATSLQQNCEMLTQQQGFVSKTQQFFSGKTPTPVQQTLENKSYLESIRSEELNKNGTSKISPLRLLRKKKFINVPQETPAPSTILETTPGLDVRKFWSTWAEEEEENVAPPQMVVLDCQNIDPEQAKLLHLIDPIQDSSSVCLETNASVIKNTESVTNSHDQGVSLGAKTTAAVSETKIDHVLPTKTAETCSAAECNQSEIDRDRQKTKENSGKKKSETMDKWTEKKFDFLKRAEESKAAEILRHEEEKMKIFETRLTLQQSLKRTEKNQNSERGDEGVPARFSSPDENSRCDSAGEAKADGSHLPTSEYRRNKFLEYSVNGEELLESEKPEEVKKEEKILGKLLEKLPADEFLCSKLKEDGGFEMDDILKKMSEINFQCAEVKLENGLDEICSRKGKKKLKRKKADHQLENEERTDKLTVETVNKPTIKFSIQKSHDLKISFKVLNSTNGKDSDEDAGVGDAEDGRKPTEELKNSTELITLKYKTIQRDGDRRLTSDSKKNRRRKKVKMKKNRYATQEERDPLADDDFVDDYKERSTPDGFQVQEKMDSAKIKLTFKRHKGNFETEYKINSSPPEEIHSTRKDEEDDYDDDDDVVAKNRSKKKSRRKRTRGIFAEPGVENIEAYSEGTCDLETTLDSQKSGPIFDEDSRGSYLKEENYHLELEPSTSPELAENLEEGKIPGDDGNVGCGQQPAELISSPVIDQNVDPGAGMKHDEVPLPSDIAIITDLAEERANSEGNEIEEISFDFVTNSKTEENESVWTDDKNDASSKNSESQQSSYKMKSERGDEEEEVLNNNKMVTEDPAKCDILPDLGLENCSENAVPYEELNETQTIGNCTPVEDEKNNETLNYETCSVENVSTRQNICFVTESYRSVLNGTKEANESQTITITSCGENNTGETHNESDKTFPVVDISSEKPLKSPVRDDFGTESCSSQDPNHLEHSSSSKNYETDSVSVASTNNSFKIVPEESQSDLRPKCKTGNSSPNAEEVGLNGEELVEEDSKNEEKLKTMENDPESLLGNDSGCAECSFSADDMQENYILKVRDTEADLPQHSDAELEDGEIVDSCDEPLEKTPERTNTPCTSKTIPKLKKTMEFLPRHIERRLSVDSEKSNAKESQTWLNKKFSKAKSCPPKFEFPRDLFEEAIPVDIPVENIPLPLGPPPLENCVHLVKYKTFIQTEDKSTVSSPPGRSSCETQYVENCCRDAPPVCDEEKIFRRSSKIKFSFLKRSKFSKNGLTTAPQVRKESDKKVEEKKTGYPKEISDTEKNTFESGGTVDNSISKECQIEEVPKEGDNAKEDVAHDPEKVKPVGETGELFCEDLDESVEMDNTIGDLIREEYYECEDIPTSEDLTNLEDLEMEKVNDDKFRNIMQNCLDNAKKFLNVGSLKLFSCSVDDLLELDCQPSESSHGDNRKSTNISRDVLLSSCEDANEELALSGNAPPADIPIDFVPSFCSDVCPEILPVDNWPYLEEEVPSSPTKPRPDETDLIPTLENGASITIALDNAIVEFRRDANFNRFRRKRLASDSEALRTCSKLCAQRRKTMDGFTGLGNGRDNIENDVAGLKLNETENNSLRCRLSLEKISSNRGGPFINDESPRDFEFGERTEKPKFLDFKSPSWQPKVMLFRISKKELRKVLKSSRIQKRFSPGSEDSPQRKVSNESESKAVSTVKRHKSDSDLEKLYVKPQQEAKNASDRLEKERTKKEEKSFDLSKLNSIKGSLTEADPETRKRKKSRFRNLHTKRKVDPENNEASKTTEPGVVDAEIAFEEMFKNYDRVSNPPKDGGTTTKDGGEKTEKMNNKATHPHDGKLREKWEKQHVERREKSEGSDRRGHRNRPREGEGSNNDKHVHIRDRSKRSRSEFERKSSSAEESKQHQRKRSSKNWVCEVCGFDDAKERVLHIKSHPFHCQSCHLAFKTEARFTSHLIKMHKDIQNQHHCLLCELSFDTEAQYQGHLESREHTHLESVEKNTINTLFTLLTGAPCPVFGVFEMKPEWLPNQAGTVHFYHQATPLSLAVQYLKMHHDLTSFPTPSSVHPN